MDNVRPRESSEEPLDSVTGPKYPKESYYICPECGAESKFPQGCLAKCGWIAPWTAAYEAKRKAKVKRAYGPSTRKRQTKAERESIYYKPCPK